MPDSKVSVVIPSYNNSSSIRKCIKSVLNQSIDAYEIIVVNDGSIDNTSEVLKKFGNKIIYLEQTNQGQGAARNTGLKAATGEYIAFLDSDDYWLPDFLKTTVLFLDNHPDAVAVNTGHLIKKFGKANYGPVLSEKDKLKYRDGEIIDSFFDFWAKYDHIRTGTVVIRKNIIDKAGYQRPDLRISQDLEYWGYIATYGKWSFISHAYWVGDSASVAAEKGWNKKYEKRRKMCPTVESWEKRIFLRLDAKDLNGFKTIRGRVACGFAFNKILGGDDIGSKLIVQKYGSQMPEAWTTMVMVYGIKGSPMRWKLICHFLRQREIIKSWFVYTFPNGSSNLLKLKKSLFN